VSIASEVPLGLDVLDASAPQSAPNLPRDRVPRHIAVVMDGNGRWAIQRGRPRSDGHVAGQDGIFETIDAVTALSVPYLTAYAFSTENWRRERQEVDQILGLIENFLRERLEQFVERGVRVQWRGREHGLPAGLLEVLGRAQDATAGCDTLVYTVCINYGGQAEIADAARVIAQRARDGLLDADEISEHTFAEFLATGGLPPVDLFIRPGGEQRLSNFLLWHSAYAEMVFPPQLWPDFDRRYVWQAVEAYARRARRFGAAL